MALMRATSRQRLPKSARLRKRSDFLRVQQGGRRMSGRHYLLIFKDSQPLAGESLRDEPGFSRSSGANARLGVTVSSKVGNAVIRNRIKRWVRECFRRHRIPSAQPLDLVVVARPGAHLVGFSRTCHEILDLLRRAFGGGPVGVTR